MSSPCLGESAPLSRTEIASPACGTQTAPVFSGSGAPRNKAWIPQGCNLGWRGLLVWLSVLHGGFLAQHSDPLVLCYHVFESGLAGCLEYVTKACCVCFSLKIFSVSWFLNWVLKYMEATPHVIFRGTFFLLKHVCFYFKITTVDVDVESRFKLI